MKNVSNLYKSTLAADGRTYRVYANFTLANGDTLALTNGEIWGGSLSFDDATSGTSTFDVGAFVIGQVSFTVNNLDGAYSDHLFDGATVQIDLGLVLTNGTEERVHLGVFNVNRAKAVNSALINLTCLSNAVKFEKSYSLSNLVYPASIGDIVRDACDMCGVTLNTQSWAGMNIMVNERPDDRYSFLQIVAAAAQACGLFARITSAGYLELAWYDIDSLEAVSDNDTYEGLSSALKAAFHYVSSLASTSICTDALTVTGVKISIGSGNTATEYLTGNEGYVLEIKGNPLIDTNNQTSVAALIGANTIGQTFYQYDISCLSDPTIEPGDLVWLVDKDGKAYRSFITHTVFSPGKYEKLECSATTPSEQKAYRVAAQTLALIKASKEAQQQISKWATVQNSLSALISAGYGMYTTNVTQADGSVISYLHDEPTMAESNAIWTRTSEGFMISRDHGATFAVDTYGNTLVHVLTAKGINADWINTGELVVKDNEGNETFYVNCDTGEVRVSATSFSLSGKTVNQITQEAVDGLEVGGRNILLKSATKSIAMPKSYQAAGGTLATEYDQTVEEWGTDSAIRIYGNAGSDKRNIGVLSGVSQTGQYYIADKSYTFSMFIKNISEQTVYARANGMPTLTSIEPGEAKRVILTYTGPTTAYVQFNFYAAEKSGAYDFLYWHPKIEYGTTATDWTPAPEDLESDISAVEMTANNAVSMANTANATANAANQTAAEALEVASSAGGLIAYLDNDYQSIPTAYDGTYTSFPECSTTISVFFNSSDVSADCTYTATASTGVTGSWNASTRTYTVTALSADTGTVTIKAEYEGNSLSKKFKLAKVRSGRNGTDGVDGQDGTNGTDGVDGTDGRGISSMGEYYAISASSTTAPTAWESSPVKPTAAKPYLWNFSRITYTDGTQADSTPLVIGNYATSGTNGRGISSITEHYGLSNSAETEPSEWSDTMVTTTTSNKYLWNYETVTYTDGTTQDTTKRIIGTHGATGSAAYNYSIILSDAAIIKNTDGTLSPGSITMTGKRATGTAAPANYAGRFKVETSTDGTTWTTAYTATANAATYTYTPSAAVKMIRCSLYLAGGTTTLLDTQTIPVISDGADGADGVSPTITSTKSNGVTTVTITDANGTRTLTINDGTDGSYVKTITNYYLASASSSGVTTSTSGWVTDPTKAVISSSKPYLWNYEVLKNDSGTTVSTSSPAIIGHYGKDGTNGTNGTNGVDGKDGVDGTNGTNGVDGKDGADGADGKGIKSITEYYALSTSTTAPAASEFSTAVKTPTAAIKYLWNYEKITYTDNTTTTTAKHIIGVYGDTGADGVDGQDAYTVILTNESHSFAGGTSAAVAGSTDCYVLAFKGATRVSATIGTITGQVTGLTTAITGNGSTSAKFTVTVTTSLKTTAGTLTIPVTVDGKSFTKTFSWTVPFRGSTAYNYSLLVSDAAVVLDNAGTLTPSSITFEGRRGTGTSTPVAYAGRFKIETSTDGEEWTAVYTSTANESAKVFSVTDTSVKLIRCSLYLAGGTTNLLDVQTIPIVSDGKDGASITSITNYYLASASASGVTTTTSGWTTDPTATAAAMTASKPYLWNYEVTKDSNGETVTTTSPVIIGRYGQNGKGISSITEYYAISNSTTAPADSAFSTSVKTPTQAKPYLWNYEKITYSDSSTTSTTKHIIGVAGKNGTSPTITTSKTDGVTTVTITDAAGTKTVTINDGADGASIASVTNYYLASASASGVTTSTSGWTTNPTASAATMTASKPYLWNYEVSKDTSGATIATTSPGIIGRYGQNGKGISSIAEYYALSATSTAPDDSAFTTTVQTPTQENPFLWNYEKITYSNSTTTTTTKHIIGICGADGTSPTVTSSKSNGVTTVKITDITGTKTVTINDGADGASVASVTNYYLASASSSGVTTSTSGWTTNPTASAATMTATKQYLWNYEVTKDADGGVISTTSPGIIGRYGQNGAAGAAGKGVSSITEYYALSTTTTAPADSSFTTAVKTPTSSNKYLWNYEKITYTDSTTTTTAKHIIGVYGDTGDNYTVVLTNESHTFAGGTSAALAASVDSFVIAYKGTSKIAATIGSITGTVTGLTATISSNGTTSAKVTIKATTSLTTKSGTLTIPVTVDGRTINKIFSWSLALSGKDGTDGVDGTNGTNGTDARTYYLNVSPKSAKLGENYTFSPNSITAQAFYRDGNSTTQTAYTAYLTIQACVDNTWKTIKNITASSYTFTIKYTSAASASISGTAISLPLTTSAMRVQLRTASGGTLLDQEEIIILVDATSFTQQAVFDKLTNNGETQGLYLEGGKIYLNATYIKSGNLEATYIRGGKLTLGGANNGNGTMEVLDASDNVKVRMDNTGIYAVAGYLGNWKITTNSIRREEADNVGNVLLQCPTSSATNVLAIGAPYDSDSGSTAWSSAPFRVTKAGKLYATSAVIGGWNVDATKLYSVNSDGKCAMVRRPPSATGNTGYCLAIGGTDTSFVSMKTYPFRVREDGFMAATNASIAGEFESVDSVGQKVQIVHGILYGKDGSTKCSTVDLSARYGNSSRNIAMAAEYDLHLKAQHRIIFAQTVDDDKEASIGYIDANGYKGPVYPTNGATLSGKVYLPASIGDGGVVNSWYEVTIKNGMVM